MLLALLLILIVLWFLGYTPVTLFPVPNIVLFSVNGYGVTLWNLLIFIVIAIVIGILPRPFREIAGVLFLLWVLSILGIFLGNLSGGIIVVIIIGIIVILFTGV